MSTAFSVIVDDFDDGLDSLLQIVGAGSNKSASPKARVASIHAATLLLAAIFEEFVREMARECAVQVVRKARTVQDLPDTLLETAWKRTFDDLARSKPTARSAKEALEISAKEARPKIDALCSFIEGDISQNISDHLIHNENNMRGREINWLFKVSGLKNTCAEICKEHALKSFFQGDDDGRTHGTLISALEDFFSRRNEIAHSLNSAKSSGPEQIYRDIEMFRAFSKDLGSTLDKAVA